MQFIRLISGLLCASSLLASAEDVEKIKGMYAATLGAMRDLKTKADVDRLIDSFQAPEWVGNMPAGETLTRVDSVNEGISVLSIPPERRPSPQMRYVYVTETGWSVLLVYWQYRQVQEKIVGSLLRDTWVRTPDGWRRTRTEKFFPDRPLSDGGKSLALPSLE